MLDSVKQKLKKGHIHASDDNCSIYSHFPAVFHKKAKKNSFLILLNLSTARSQKNI